ncbi:hypothetical protein FRC11_012761 [Ceratobasidium sp. 423]|nr:hypothetical protein FRC11_012761 [Ceratobasidium sp. 423]
MTMNSAHDPEGRLRPSEEQHGEGNRESTLERPSKRTRTNALKQKAPRKKYIKGKQGGLQGIMEMPVEVFMEVQKLTFLLFSR